MDSGEVLFEKRGHCMTRLQKIYDFVMKAAVSQFDAVEVRIEEIGKIRDKFQIIQDELIAFNASLDDKSSGFDVDEIQTYFEDCYFSILLKYKKMKNAMSEQAECKSVPDAPAGTIFPSAADNVLPKIKIPRFNGNAADWHNFISLFKSAIHASNNLSLTAKLYHLRSLLDGEALKLIELFPLDDQSYLLAFKALTDRYENKRLRASFYLNQIVSYSIVQLNSRNNLQGFLSIHKDCFAAFDTLDISDKFDFFYFYLCYMHLDKATQLEFDKLYQPNVLPTKDNLFDFLMHRLQYADLNATHATISSCNSNNPKGQKQAKASPSSASAQRHHALLTSAESAKINPCCLCSSSHLLFRCPSFLQMNISKRREFVAGKRLCFNCLGTHFRSSCRSSSRCFQCKDMHHTLLHEEKPSVRSVPFVPSELPPPSVPRPVSPAPQSSVVLSAKVEGLASALLATAVVLLKDRSGHLQPVRAVIDTGSQLTILSAACCKRLGLKLLQSSVEIAGIGTAHAIGMAQFQMTSRCDPLFTLSLEAAVLSSLAPVLPSASLPDSVKERFKNLNLADPFFNLPAPVDIVLSAAVYVDILKPGGCSIGGDPVALDTSLGFIIMGRIPKVAPSKAVSLFSACTPLDSLLRSFWETEAVSSHPIINPDDEYCEKHFLETCTRTATGRYSVGLPVKPGMPSLGRNREIATRNFVNFEKRLLQADLHSKYVSDMQQYVDEGYMTPASRPASYVIPQNLVLKDSSTTSARTVFNASAKDNIGLSLNDRLFCGPKLQQDISYVLSTFRLPRICISTDLKKMYLQILVKEPDCFLQNILWRRSPDDPLLDYVLRTVTFGVNCSPFLALRVIQQIVCDEGSRFPLAAAAVSTGTYMDNITGGADTVEEARELCHQLSEMFGCTGFFPRKWSSSNPDVLKGFPDEDRDQPLLISSDDVYNVLGMEWRASSDSFCFHFRAFSGCVTKRSVLSYVARIYDPLGLLAPVVLTAKAFVQKLWLAGNSWDEELPPDLQSQWNEYTGQFPILENLSIPRYALSTSPSDLQLLCFCDASSIGYSAAVYLRSSSDLGTSLSLLRAKTKVAPLKTMSIPRLELSAAVLLVKLFASMSDFRQCLPPHSYHFFSDSTIVLGWIRTAPHKLCTFVANRVVEILDLTSPSDWHHVLSENNPSDCASRGLLPAALLDHPLWWSAAPLFREPAALWLQSSPDVPADLPELKSKCLVAATDSLDPPIDPFDRFSSLTRLQRCYAYVLRYLSILRDKKKIRGPLTAHELESALLAVVRTQQIHSFANDLNRLATGKLLSSPLRPLSPFLEHGVLRVGGRLHQSSLPDDAKHPILIPKKCRLARLLCLHYHELSAHSGPQTSLALLQQRFWVIGARSLLRFIVRNCVTCARRRAAPVQPVMAPLPAARVRPSRPFTVCGTDIGGPFLMKHGNRRNAPVEKAYLCVFICFSTKCVHLEVLTSLSMQAFLACFTRFCSRRSTPKEVWSDQGRNYVAAGRYIREAVAFFNDNTDELVSALAQRAVEFKTIPSYSPTFGGIWERAIGSSKRLLKNLVKDEVMSFECLATLFCRVEAILNSRPLCELPSSAEDDLRYLCPGSFLVGGPLVSPPELGIDLNMPLQCRYERIVQLSQAFWRQWSTIYLHSIIKRTKWSTSRGELAEGLMVLVPGVRTSSLTWPIGRVVKLYFGSDGVSRVATVKTQWGLITRAANRLVILPTSDVFA